MFGEAQMEWLMAALASSRATFKIVAGGNQMPNPVTPYEAFGRFPAEQQKRIAKPYETKDGHLIPAVVGSLVGRDLADRNRVPLANGGLYGTAGDYGRFLRMLLNDGTLDGKQYLKPETVKQMSAVQTGEMKVGFTPGNGWGLGVCVVREPQGPSAMLSPGSFGHGGAYGTQAWIDPAKKRAYILMVQRANFPNSDASEVRRAFQAAASEALDAKKGS